MSTLEELAEQGIMPTGVKFADLHIFKSTDHGYLMLKSGNEYAIYAQYPIKTKDLGDDKECA